MVVLYGARQVGKTTLVKEYLKTYEKESAYYTGDNLEFSDAVSKCSLEIFKKMFTGISLIVIDEAQKIENIGRAVKLIVDNMNFVKFILTGSSSFDLANKTGETLTGRKTVRTLYPISQKEILQKTSQFRTEKDLPEYLIYGSYPSVLTAKNLY